MLSLPLYDYGQIPADSTHKRALPPSLPQIAEAFAGICHELVTNFQKYANTEIQKVSGTIYPSASAEIIGVVLGAGLEPARLAPHAPQTCVSANSTTRALSWGQRN